MHFGSLGISHHHLAPRERGNIASVSSFRSKTQNKKKQSNSLEKKNEQNPTLQNQIQNLNSGCRTCATTQVHGEAPGIRGENKHSAGQSTPQQTNQQEQKEGTEAVHTGEQRSLHTGETQEEQLQKTQGNVKQPLMRHRRTGS